MDNYIFLIALPALMGSIFFNLAIVIIKDIPGLAKNIKDNGKLDKCAIKLFKRILVYLETAFYTTYFVFFVFIVLAFSKVLECILSVENVKISIGILVFFAILICCYRVIKMLDRIENKTLPGFFGNINGWASAFKVPWFCYAGVIIFTLIIIGLTVGFWLYDGEMSTYFILLSTSSFLVWVLALLINPLRAYFRLVDLSGYPPCSPS